MKIIVSACLLGENCKYSGGNNYSETVARYTEGHEVVCVCPEVLGGLPVPREPAEIVNGRVTFTGGGDADPEFRLGAEKALSIALESGAELAILQPRSPSCGVHEIYDGTFSKKRVPGEGVFAGLLKANGIRTAEPEELESLFKSGAFCRKA